MNIIERMKAFSIYFATPTIDGKVGAHYLKNMLYTQKLLNKNGIHSDVSLVQRDVYVQRARNELAADFLESGYTHLFFIDADMGWEPKKIIKMLARDKDVLFGAYIHKSKNGKYVHQVEKNGSEKLITHDGLVKCVSGPTGLMCIKRNVFETMISEHPEMMYFDATGKKQYDFFSCSVKNINGTPLWFGEDIDFCQKWRDMDGEIWCEPDITVNHEGMNIWKCNYFEDLKKVNSSNNSWASQKESENVLARMKKKAIQY